MDSELAGDVMRLPPGRFERHQQAGARLSPDPIEFALCRRAHGVADDFLDQLERGNQPAEALRIEIQLRCVEIDPGVDPHARTIDRRDEIPVARSPNGGRCDASCQGSADAWRMRTWLPAARTKPPGV